MTPPRVLGHEALWASLAAAYRIGRLGHAYLCSGPRGVGKFTFARELARTLLCDARSAKFEACGRCDACLLVDAGTHPDLFLTGRPDDVLELPIATIQELLGNLSLKPARGGRKIAIVDDADDLNEASANCFLKTLEEPPPASLLILIGGPDAERQLPTILSRCQLLRFMPLAPDLLNRVLELNGVADASRRTRLLRLANGCPGQALALDDDEIWNFRGELLNWLGSERFDPRETAKRWQQFIDESGKEAAAHRQRASLILRMLIGMLEAALKIAAGATAPDLDAAEARILTQLAARLGEDRLLAWIDRTLQADMHIDRRVQLVLAMEGFIDASSRIAII